MSLDKIFNKSVVVISKSDRLVFGVILLAALFYRLCSLPWFVGFFICEHCYLNVDKFL